MKILLLGPSLIFQNELKNYLINLGNFVFHTEEDIQLNYIVKNNLEFLISFGYRRLIKKEILKHFKNNAINLHISFLPWNKGADPNLWSFLDATPTGVSIHILNEKIDEGDILCQKYINFYSEETLESTYQILNENIIELFKDNWLSILNNEIKPVKQNNNGTYHKKSEKIKYNYLLENGWKTKIYSILGKGLENENRK